MDWLGFYRKIFIRFPVNSRVLNLVKYTNLNIPCRFLGLVHYSCIYSSFKELFSNSDYQHLELTSKQIRKHFLNFSSVSYNPHYISFSDTLGTEERKILINDMVVIEDFLNEDEEESLLTEVEPYMKRLRYEFAHWDDVCIIS